MGLDKGDLTRTESTRDADRELDDFNAELSGTKSGYTYVTSAAASESRPNIRAKEARKAEARLTALQTLLDSDPAYAEAYFEAKDTINDFKDRMEQRLNKIDERIEDIDEKLDALGAGAAGSTEYKRLTKEREALQRNQQDLLDYHTTVIEPIEKRVADPHNPLSEDDLDKFNDRVKKDIERIFEAPEQTATVEQDVPIQTANVEIPKL